jgi:hypothetical protein
VDALKEFQSLVVGTLGFAGVILTLFVNAYLARKARRDSVNHDRSLIRIALLEELKIIESAFKSRVETIKAAEADGSIGILMPLATMTNVYDRLLDKLGLLNSAQIPKVMAAYLAVQQLPERLMLIRRSRQEERPGFVEVDSAVFASVKEMHSNYLRVISDAVVTLEEEALPV